MFRDSMVARRLGRIRPSCSRNLITIAQRIPSVINLRIGESDFTPPAAHAIQSTLQNERWTRENTLPGSAGVPHLREAITKEGKT